MTAANFTRRRDLFADAGFPSPDAMVDRVVARAEAAGILGADSHERIGSDAEVERACLAALASLPAPLADLCARAPAYFYEKQGDLATLLWLLRTVAPGLPEDTLADALLGAAGALLRDGRRREASALLRFVVAVDFTFGDVFKELGVAYGFFRAREPNPFVWKTLEFLEERGRAHPCDPFAGIRLLELGCGIGNDALGFLSSPRLRSYVGTDIGADALKAHAAQVAPALEAARAAGRAVDYDLREGDFVPLLRDADALGGAARRPNLIYSYSSLHYFSSAEVREIFGLVRALLEPGRGLFAFAIKGYGSVWDGQGVPLYRPDVWVNLDGQSRWFPSSAAVKAMIDAHGFELVLHDRHEHWGYSEAGKRDVFHYCLCTPRASGQFEI